METPPADGLRARLARLSPEQRAALGRRLGKSLGPESSALPPGVVPPGEAPLSYAQERICFLEQLAPENPYYNRPASLRFRGPIDPAALAFALNRVVERHDVLRTTLRPGTAGPCQHVQPHEPFPLTLEECPAGERTASESWLHAAAEADAKTCFDLATGPLFRARLLRRSREDHLLLLTFHHAIFDGWSATVLQDELAAHYRAFVESNVPPPPPRALPLQYGAFAAGQRARSEHPAQRAALESAVRRLAGHSGILDLPLDYPRPAILGNRGDIAVRVLPPGLDAQLSALSAGEGVTLFMTLAATFGILLHRHVHDDDILVGVPIAGRSRLETEPLIGCFINTVVLRVHLAGDPTVRTILGRVREDTLAALAEEEVPFEKLVSEIRPPRDRSRTPIFQALFQLRNLPSPSNAWPGLDVEPHPVHTGTAKTDLSFDVQRNRGLLRVQCEFNACLFSRSTIERLLEHYELLLRGMVGAPTARISRLSLRTPSDDVVLPDPRTPLDVPPLPGPVEVIRDLARQQPDAICLRQGDLAWSRRTLDQATESLAAFISARRDADRPVVAITGSRSFGLIAALLAVLRSGFTLLLLDPALPRMRRISMLRQANPGLLLDVSDGPGASDGPVLEAGQEASVTLHRLDPRTGAPVEATPGPVPVSAPPRDEESRRAESDAYLFFTSGTTGVPKAIRGSRRGLAHFLHWQRTTFGLGPADRAAQLVGLSFDVVLRDILTPLTAGSTLCLPAEAEALLPDHLLPWLRRDRITLIHAVPSLARAWLDAAPAGFELPDLRHVFFAGEPLPDTLIRRWRSLAPACRILNLYGPTETTLAKCFHEIAGDPVPGIQPIGRPLPETQALVLTASRQLCAVREAGEIAIRTPFRSHGYLQAPTETSDRFIPNPWREDPGDLLYLTGDRGRYRPDGSLEILGRLDFQLKIRGMRVEPEEVAATLSRHPAVRQCVVLARDDDAGEKQLVAAVVTATPDATLSATLTLFLRESLPPAFVPSAFLFVASIPLTANGKIDRPALLRLPLPRASNSGRVEPFPASPQGELERRIADIWSGFLAGKSLHQQSDFFEQGGHSLLALQVLARMKAELGTAPSLADFFRHPTITALAALIDPARPPSGPTSSTPTPGTRRLLGSGTGVPLFVVPGIFGLGGLRPSLVEALRDVAPYYDRLRYPGVDDDLPPAATMDGLATHLIGQIREIHPPGKGPLCLAGFSYGGMVAFEIACRLRAQGEEVALLILFDTRLPRNFRERSTGQYLREIARRVRSQPARDRWPFLLGLLQARFKSMALRRTRRGTPLAVPAQRPAGPGEAPAAGVTATVVASGLLKTSVRLASKQAAQGYHPEPYPGRVVLFRATELRPNEWLRQELPPCNGWGGLVTGRLEIIPVPRDHLGVYTEPLHPVVVEWTAQLLREAQTTGPARG